MKKLLTLALIIVLTVTMVVALSVNASAAKIGVCAINSTSYPTVQAAVDAAGTNPVTITLINNAIDNVRIPEGANITLDLNGCVLSPENADVAVIYNEGTLKIVDSNLNNKTHYFTFVKDGAWVLNDTAEQSAKENALTVADVLTATPDNGALVKVEGGVITRNATGLEFASIYNDSGATLTVENVNLIGNATQHSAIYNVHATLTVNHANILGNTAYSGAGIKNYNGSATVGKTDGELTDVVIAYNTTTATGNLGDGGAAIYNVLATRETAVGDETTATLTVNKATLNNNKSAYKGGAIANAVYKNGTASVILNGTEIKNNSSAHNGGAISNYIMNANGVATLTVNGGNVSGNNAITRTYTQTSASGGNGGAIANTGVVTLTGDVKIENNNACLGGAIYNAGALTVTSATIQNNKAKLVNGASFASYEGLVGGIYNDHGSLTVNGGSVKNNTADVNVGGIFNELGQLTVTGGTVTGNASGTQQKPGIGGVAQMGVMTLSGNATITGNANGNLCVANGTTVTVSAFTGTAGVCMLNTTDYSVMEGTFTSANANGYLSRFTSDVPAYNVVAASNGALTLTSTATYLDNTTSSKELDQNYTLAVTDNGYTDVTKVKVEWTITDITVTRTDSKIWDPDNLVWKDVKEASVTNNGSATFKITNLSSVKIDAKVTFATTFTNPTVSYSEDADANGKVTVATVVKANKDVDTTITHEKTIGVTVEPKADDFKSLSATTTPTKYGTYTVTISEYECDVCDIINNYNTVYFACLENASSYEELFAMSKSDFNENNSVSSEDETKYQAYKTAFRAVRDIDDELILVEKLGVLSSDSSLKTYDDEQEESYKFTVEKLSCVSDPEVFLYLFAK